MAAKRVSSVRGPDHAALALTYVCLLDVVDELVVVPEVQAALAELATIRVLSRKHCYWPN